MLRKNRLFTPGPTPILPAAQTAMASFAMHHRTADFRALYTRVLADMKDFIGTRNDVLVLASSVTGAMEGSGSMALPAWVQPTSMWTAGEAKSLSAVRKKR